VAAGIRAQVAAERAAAAADRPSMPSYGTVVRRGPRPAPGCAALA